MSKGKKTILFLGGNGFLGKNILAWADQSAEIRESIRFVAAGLNIENDPLPWTGSLDRVELDFTDREALRRVFESYQIDEVFHFAGAGVPATSNQNIEADIQNNLLGAIHLLTLTADFKVPKITFISSGGAVYGEPSGRDFQEDDPYNPNSSYGIIKLTIEKYIRLFSRLYGLKHLILRPSNPFGPYHTSRRNGIVNIAVRNALENQPVTVWGDGLQKKDYIYSLDFAKIFWNLYLRDVSGKTLNVGSGNLYSILDILKTVKAVIPALEWHFESSKSFDTPHMEIRLDALKQIMPIENTRFEDAVKACKKWETEKY